MTKTGLIIAAGAGTRLANKQRIHKTLRKVAGLPLLRRIILSAHRGGLERIVIVVGFQKEQIIEYVESQEWPVQIDFAVNEEWKKSNGVSVLAAKDHIKENFVLMMADHIFDSNTLRGLCEEGLGTMHAKLAIDYKTHQIFDEDDATKVLVKDGQIVAINKVLKEFNAIDTGMFLMSPVIFDALEKAKVDGDCSLSQGIQTLSETGKMGVYDIGAAYWQDVDTKEALRNAEKVLVRSCRKDTDGFISRNFNRYISGFISSFLVKTPLTANQVTYMITVLGLLSGYYAAGGTYGTYLVAAFLFVATSILDGVDGEMARLRMTQSKFGQWLDTASDNLTYVVFFVGTVLGLIKRQDTYVVVAGPMAIVGVIFLVAAMVLFLKRHSDSGSFVAIQQNLANDQNSALSSFASKIGFVIKRDFFASAFFFFALFDKASWVLISVALAANIAWMIILKKALEPVKVSASS